MRVVGCVGVTAVLLTSVGIGRGGDEPAYSPSVDGVSAPVAYDGLMLVLIHEKGVAAVVFGDETPDGVKYKYRYLPKGGVEAAGAGEVFERYIRLPGDKPNETRVIDDGGQLYLKAGPARVEWSYGGKGKGHIYYRPEYVRVESANARDFEKLDLSRFLK
jgi:hypothetical protein